MVAAYIIATQTGIGVSDPANVTVTLSGQTSTLAQWGTMTVTAITSSPSR